MVFRQSFYRILTQSKKFRDLSRLEPSICNHFFWKRAPSAVYARFSPSFDLTRIGPETGPHWIGLGPGYFTLHASKSAILSLIKDNSEHTDYLDNRRQEIDTSARSQR